MSEMGVRREKAARSSGCKSHPAKHRTSANGEVVVLRGIAAETEEAFARYHAAEDELRALPTLAALREGAPELVLLAKEALSLMHDRDVEADLHPEHVELKGQAVTQLIVRGLESVCEWTHEQAWACYNGPDVDGIQLWDDRQ